MCSSLSDSSVVMRVLPRHQPRVCMWAYIANFRGAFLLWNATCASLLEDVGRRQLRMQFASAKYLLELCVDVKNRKRTSSVLEASELSLNRKYIQCQRMRIPF